MENPFNIVETFEKQVAEYTGAPYAVATDCCTHALYMSLYHEKNFNGLTKVSIPERTYVSVPMQVKHSGVLLEFEDYEWSGAYQLKGSRIVDSAARFTKGCYTPGTLTCLSFQYKKILSTIRGGMILTDDVDFYEWAKLAVHDGRDMSIPYKNDEPMFLGFHYFMTPETAQLGIDGLAKLPAENKDCANSNTYSSVLYVTDLQV
jgi:dTDP-4-amino-4,6-dideoxygalactose transaminase